MTRPLHPETNVQRADNSDAVSREARERGYEERDAPAGKVIGGMAAFLGLMVVGLAFAALLLVRLLAQEDHPRAPFADQQVVPPPPRLVADPVAERARVEGPARERLRQADLADAEAALLGRGWPENGPAEATADTARAHRDSLP